MFVYIHSAFGPDPIPYPKREFFNEEDNDTESNKVYLLIKETCHNCLRNLNYSNLINQLAN